MKVIVTGGFGFLGAQVTAALLRDGYDVVPCSRRVGLDLRDQDKAMRFFSQERADLVVHCAAHVGGIAYNELHPVEIFDDNVRIGLGLVAAMERSGIQKLINVMPNCTYPGDRTLYIENEWWHGQIHPSVLAYGLPRKMLWGLTWAHAKKWGMQFVHLILPNMYGPGDHFDPIRSHALGAMIAKIVEAKRNNEKEVIIWGTGKPVREWLYIEDGALAISRALEKFEDARHIADGILNIGVGKGVTITEMAETIRGYVDWDGRFLYDTTRPDGAMIKLLDPKRMKAVLDWVPPTDFEEGVRRTVEWYLAHH